MLQAMGTVHVGTDSAADFKLYFVSKEHDSFLFSCMKEKVTSCSGNYNAGMGSIII